LSETPNHRCRICSSFLKDQILSVSEKMFALGKTFNYRECSTCGCVQIASYPENLASYYPMHYYSFGHKVSGRSLKLRMKTIRNHFTYHRKGLFGWGLSVLLPNHFLRILRNTKGVQPESSVLDVGCGYGEQLLALQLLGFNKLTGIDPNNQSDIYLGNGLHIFKKSLLEMQQKYDVVMMHHVLEHMSGQKQVFEQVHERLLPDGCFIIRIPLSDSFAREKYQSDWVQWDPPRHLYLHTRKSIESLCKQCGFQTETIVYDSNGMQFWGSELYRRGLPLFDHFGQPAPLLKYFSIPKLIYYNRLALRLNRLQQGDQAIFVMRKIKTV